MPLPPTPQKQLEQWALRAKETLRSTGPVSTEALHIISQSLPGAFHAAARRREMNTDSPFAMLPPVLLKRILQDALVRIHDVLAVSQSCHRLRCVILASPGLWSKTIILSPHGYKRLTYDRRIIRRSNPAPLQMALFVASLPNPSGWTEACCQIMTENMERLSRLELYTEIYVPHSLWSEDQGPGVWPPMIVREENQDTLQSVATFYALEQPAPLLREFVMHRHVYLPRRPLTLPENIFCGEAPLLRSCVLSGIVLSPHGYRAFANLVNLHYHTWNNLDSLRLEDIRGILDSLPSLEMICFARHVFSQESSSTTSEAGSPVMKTALKTVRLLRVFTDAPRSLDFGAMQAFFIARGVQRFEVEYAGRRFIKAEHLVRMYPRLEAMTIRPRYIELRSARSTVLLWREHTLSSSICSNPQMYTHLQHLSIHGNCWPQDEAIPAAPLLTSLCIVLGGCAEYRWCSHMLTMPWLDAAVTTCSVFHAYHPWVCPALRSVHFAYRPPEKDCTLMLAEKSDWPTATACCCAKKLTISLRDVHRFVAKCLCFEGNRLAVLKLSGVEPIDSEAREMLSSLAEDVQISSLVDWDAVAQTESILKCREYHPGTQ